MEEDITASEVQNILSHYDIGDFVSYKRISQGLANRNYKLTTTNGDFLLKICDEKTPDELQIQIRALDHLKKHNFPTAFPVQLKNGEYYYASDIRAIIFNFLQGKSGKSTPGVISEIGFVLGKLHLLPPLEGLPAFNIDLKVMSDFLIEIANTEFIHHQFISILKTALNTLKPVENPELPSGMLHADLFADNAIFDENEKLIGVVDWEEACFANILDVSMAIVGCCFPPGQSIDYDLYSSFIQSYHICFTFFVVLFL